MAADPVCGMEVDVQTSRWSSEHEREIYYFCAEGCKRSFDAAPEKYLNPAKPVAAGESLQWDETSTLAPGEMAQVTLPVTGMHCAGCANAIERKLGNTPGVTEAVVNLTMEKAHVKYNPSLVRIQDLVQAVQSAGYDVKQDERKIILKITGMHCTGCANNVEKSIAKVDGVTDVSVTFATEQAVVTHDANLVQMDHLAKAVRAAGYDVLEETQESKTSFVDDQMARVARYRKLMTWAWGITGPMMLVMLGHMLFNWHIPGLELLFLLAAAPVVFWVGVETHKSSLNVLRHGGTNMDVLITLGSVAAFFTGIAALFLPVASYAAVAAMIICFHITGRYLEFKAKGRTSQAIRKLLTLEAKSARILVDGEEKEIAAEDLMPGDIMLVKPGEKIPTDGVVVKGRSYVDESIATGESLPVERQEEDEVLGATINKEGVLHVRATRVGKDTFLAQVVRLVEECQGTKVPIQEFADRVTTIFVPTIIVLAIATLLGWLLFDDAFQAVAQWGAQFLPWLNPDLSPVSLAIFAAVAVLVIACPCALGLATPTVLMVASGIGAQNGILIRNGAAIQALQEIDTIVLDKTGTITKGTPEVTDIIPIDSFSKDDVLRLAAAAEQNSEHPLAQAVVEQSRQEGIKLSSATQFQAMPGKGIHCRIADADVKVGNPRWLAETGVAENGVHDRILGFEEQGKTVILLAVNDKLAGVIAVADAIKEDSAKAIAELSRRGLRTVMLTGDNARTARFVADLVGIDETISEVLPEDKVNQIKRLQEEGRRVLMVGDGINDAPALTQADVGMAIGTGTDIAIESSDVTLVRGDLSSVVKALRLSRATFKKIKQNLFWAFFYNVVMIPVAMLGLLHPALAEAAMAASSVNVVSNSLRLRKTRL